MPMPSSWAKDRLCLCYPRDVPYIVPKLTDSNNDLQPMAFAAFSVMLLIMIYRNSLYDIDNIATRFWAAASVLSETFRDVAKVYRTGGDEFYVLSTSSVTPENLAALTDRLDEAAAARRGEMSENLSLSYGFAFGREEPETTVEQLLILADKRMYASKRRYYDSQELDRRGSY